MGYYGFTIYGVIILFPKVMKMFSGTVRSSKIECLYSGLQLSKACPDRPTYILTTGKRYARDKLVFEPESLDSYINDGWYITHRIKNGVIYQYLEIL